MTFVSYAREDSKFVLKLARDLKSAGAPVWLDQFDMKLGQPWDEQVEEALARCDQILVILSPVAVKSKNVLNEIEYALDEGKTVIPVLHEQCPVPLLLRRLQYVDFRQDYKAGLTSLLGTLERVDVDKTASPPPVSKPEQPTPRAGGVRRNPADGQPYVWIPPGEFRMGCSEGDTECRDDEKPPHAVRLTRGFWLGQTPVTQAAYEKVIGANPSLFKGPQFPVETVNWHDASKYCELVGGRLPTEAEWEYAARAGSHQAYYGELDKIAWYDSNSAGKTHQVGQKQANPWGLYDILGNVWEWVADWHQEDYYESLPSPAIDPRGSPSGKWRVLRGGAWDNSARNLRVSDRDWLRAEDRDNDVGFRCARDVIPL